MSLTVFELFRAFLPLRLPVVAPCCCFSVVVVRCCCPLLLLCVLCYDAANIRCVPVHVRLACYVCVYVMVMCVWMRRQVLCVATYDRTGHRRSSAACCRMGPGNRRAVIIIVTFFVFFCFFLFFLLFFCCLGVAAVALWPAATTATDTGKSGKAQFVRVRAERIFGAAWAISSISTVRGPATCPQLPHRPGASVVQRDRPALPAKVAFARQLPHRRALITRNSTVRSCALIATAVVVTSLLIPSRRGADLRTTMDGWMALPPAAFVFLFAAVGWGGSLLIAAY